MGVNGDGAPADHQFSHIPGWAETRHDGHSIIRWPPDFCFVSLSRTCRWGIEGLGIFVASRSTVVQSVARLAIGEHGP